jgi:hypothetical protein
MNLDLDLFGSEERIDGDVSDRRLSHDQPTAGEQAEADTEHKRPAHLRGPSRIPGRRRLHGFIKLAGRDQLIAEPE